MKRYNPSALYLVAITVCDISYQIFHVLFYLKYFWGFSSLGFPGLCQIWNILNMVPQYGSQLLVLGFTTERFISIIRPFQSDRFSRIKRAPYEVGTIMIFVFLLSIPQGYFWHLNGKGACVIRTQSAILVFYEHWAIVTESILFLIVPITNLILNYIVLRKTSQALRHNEYLRTNSINHCKANQNFRQNKPMTKTLLAIAFFRILTQLPMSVTYTLQNFPSLNFGPFPMPLAQMAYDPQWKRFLNYYSVRILIETFAVSHHALSFFIFYASTKQFRDELHRNLKWFSTVSLRRRPATTRLKITST
ncbi:leukotriene B4 receptor 1-like [Mya arenaria]|uniref:leukotriene B4 receptor 1-like n=1 Tax=Mya arenaria TaxID=6604 RepID=UPI0022E75347|nr:leukotriene B4 receptor 1-like [Mya arenaria]